VVFNEFDEPRPKVPLDPSKRPAERSRGDRTHHTLDGPPLSDDPPLSAQPERQEAVDLEMGVVADVP
jgi:hypothetical protein